MRLSKNNRPVYIHNEKWEAGSDFGELHKLLPQESERTTRPSPIPNSRGLRARRGRSLTRHSGKARPLRPAPLQVPRRALMLRPWAILGPPGACRLGFTCQGPSPVGSIREPTALVNLPPNGRVISLLRAWVSASGKGGQNDLQSPPCRGGQVWAPRQGGMEEPSVA